MRILRLLLIILPLACSTSITCFGAEPEISEDFELPVSEAALEAIVGMADYCKKDVPGFFLMNGVPQASNATMKLDAKKKVLRVRNHRRGILLTMTVLANIEMRHQLGLSGDEIVREFIAHTESVECGWPHTKKFRAEQGGAGEPATRSESDSEGGDKPQPEPEGRSR